MTQTARAPRAHKSTTDRSKLKWVAAGVRAVSPVAPALAARVVESLMLHARRHPRPAWEAELLIRADRSWSLPWREEGKPTALRLWSWGEGPVVLLVHGWEGRGSQLGAFVAPLVAAGFRVVTFDGPGHGASSARRASLVDMARAVDAVADAVAPILGGIHAVIAHSMGGAATVLAAAKQSSRGSLTTARVVLVAPPSHPGQFTKPVFEAFSLSEDLRHRVVDRMEQHLGERFADLDGPVAAARLDNPALLVHDADDREVHVVNSERYAASWPGARLLRTGGLGHRRILRDPQVVAQVTRFVAGRDRG
jgi:pimeloyl-ACP methyl ester carboxylesterase